MLFLFDAVSQCRKPASINKTSSNGICYKFLQECTLKILPFSVAVIRPYVIICLANSVLVHCCSHVVLKYKDRKIITWIRTIINYRCNGRNLNLCFHHKHNLWNIEWQTSRHNIVKMISRSIKLGVCNLIFWLFLMT